MTSRTRATLLNQVAAIARRDFSVERSYQFQFFLQFVGIVFSLTTFFFVSKLVGDAEELGAYQGEYFGFALIGVLLISSTVVGLSTFSKTIAAEQTGGTLEVLLATPTRLTALLAGAFVVPIVLAAIEIVLFVLLATLVFGARFPLAGLAMAAPVLALTVLVFCAFGITSAALIVLTKRGDPFSPLIANATALLAGAVFPVGLLPGPLEALSRVIPAFYGLNAMRALLLAGAGPADVITDVLMLVLFAAGLLPASVWVLSRALRIARVMGTLGNY